MPGLAGNSVFRSAASKTGNGTETRNSAEFRQNSLFRWFPVPLCVPQKRNGMSSALPESTGRYYDGGHYGGGIGFAAVIAS